MKKNTKKLETILIISIIFCLGAIIYVSFNNDTALKIQINNLKTEKKQLKNTIKELQDNQAEVPLKKDILQGTYSLEKLEGLNLDGYDNVMFSTHPDDDMFWGGGHLIESNYLVVCVTCGMDANRQAEFETVMEATNSRYVELNYPASVDKNLIREFDWRAASYLSQDIENILNLKEWKLIVTHNPDGEYGHKYHKLTSQIVTSLVQDKSKLYYFGKYYTKDQTNNLSTDTLSEETYNQKLEIIKNYKSQSGSALNHGHMFKNENFIKYSDWN